MDGTYEDPFAHWHSYRLYVIHQIDQHHKSDIDLGHILWQQDNMGIALYCIEPCNGILETDFGLEIERTEDEEVRESATECLFLTWKQICRNNSH